MSGFTCISCRVSFIDADLQRGHYKTDWHRYNLKRKVADLPPVTAENFQERVLAQKAQVASADESKVHSCSVCNKKFNTKNAFENHLLSKKHKELDAKFASKKPKDEPVPADMTEKEKEIETEKKNVMDKNAKNIAIKEALAGSRVKGQGSSRDLDEAGPSSRTHAQQGAASMETNEDDSDAESCEEWEGEALGLEECLFCSHISQTMDHSICHMTSTHSFFIPDVEYLIDLEGLITYLGEKVGDGHVCLWCNEKGRSFQSTGAVQQHMVDKGHCKILHEGNAVLEYADFYDYRPSYPDYQPGQEEEAGGQEEPMEQGDDDTQIDDLDAESYQLVLPSGATIGHRSLQKYYRQKLRPDRTVALRNPSALSKVMAHYKALGWTGSTGAAVFQKAKDIAFVQRHQHKQRMRLGVKANKFQPHFRCQVFGT